MYVRDGGAQAAPRQGVQVASILVGTTLQPTSDAVIQTALAVAARTGARLHVFHAYAPMVLTAAEAMPITLPDEAQLIEAQLAAQLTRLGIDRVAGDRVAGDRQQLGSIQIGIGPAHRALIERAGEVHADLLVVGAAETYPGLARIFGSTADRVLRKSTRPLLVVRQTPAQPLRRVLLPVDLSALSGDAFRRGLAMLGALGADADTHIEALLVIEALAGTRQTDLLGPREVDEEARQQLAAFVARHTSGVNDLAMWRLGINVLRGDPEKAILERMHEWQPDLVVLGTHGASGFERLLLGSVAGSVIRHGTVTALVVPPEAALAAALAHEAAQAIEAVPV
jgi:nucleotide-binding universal stress UspA family protein